MTRSQKKELRDLLKETVFKRDHDKCRRCSSELRLAPAHIYPKGSHPAMEFDIDNVLTLCYHCHIYFFHKDPTGTAEWLKDNLPPKMLERLKIRSQVKKSTVGYSEWKLFLEKEVIKYG